MRHNSPDLYGPLTEDNLLQFHTDLAILGADAVSPDGLFTSDMGIARVSRAMIEAARENWLVVDSSKFSAHSFVKFADLSSIQHVVTGQEVSTQDREWVEADGRTLHIVDPESV